MMDHEFVAAAMAQLWQWEEVEGMSLRRKIEAGDMQFWFRVWNSSFDLNQIITWREISECVSLNYCASFARFQRTWQTHIEFQKQNRARIFQPQKK